MPTQDFRPLDGGCTCRHVRYRMTTAPLFVHCCHCRWCQRETGSSYALNAMIEADRVQLSHGDVDVVATPTASGKGQKISRCPHCRVAVWGNYAGAGDAVRWISDVRRFQRDYPGWDFAYDLDRTLTEMIAAVRERSAQPPRR